MSITWTSKNEAVQLAGDQHDVDRASLPFSGGPVPEAIKETLYGASSGLWGNYVAIVTPWGFPPS